MGDLPKTNKKWMLLMVFLLLLAAFLLAKVALDKILVPNERANGEPLDAFYNFSMEGWVNSGLMNFASNSLNATEVQSISMRKPQNITNGNVTIASIGPEIKAKLFKTVQSDDDLIASLVFKHRPPMIYQGEHYLGDTKIVRYQYNTSKGYAAVMDFFRKGDYFAYVSYLSYNEDDATKMISYLLNEVLL